MCSYWCDDDLNLMETDPVTSINQSRRQTLSLLFWWQRTNCKSYWTNSTNALQGLKSNKTIPVLLACQSCFQRRRKNGLHGVTFIHHLPQKRKLDWPKQIGKSPLLGNYCMETSWCYRLGGQWDAALKCDREIIDYSLVLKDLNCRNCLIGRWRNLEVHNRKGTEGTSGSRKPLISEG